MMLEPVEYASSTVRNENSLVDQMTTSSASREMSTAVMALTKANSAAKSRLAVPSMELSTAAVKPRSAATASGSSPRELPASAPDPYGEMPARRSQSCQRSTPRNDQVATLFR